MNQIASSFSSSASIASSSSTSTTGGGLVSPTNNNNGVTPARGIISASSSTLANQTTNETNLALMTEKNENDIIPSVCFEALKIHLSRLLKPFWEWTIGREREREKEKKKKEEKYLTLFSVNESNFRFTAKQLNWLVTPLQNLLSFMQNAAPFKDMTVSGLSLSRGGKVCKTPYEVECVCAFRIMQLLSQAIQALNLLLEIHSCLGPGFTFERLRLNKGDINLAKQITFANFISSEQGRELASAFIKATLESSSVGEEGKLFVKNLQDASFDFFSKGDALQVLIRNEFQFVKGSKSVSEINVHLNRIFEMCVKVKK